jgi:penicillin amidase
MSKRWLRRLGAGESIADVCRTEGFSREQFEELWRQELARRIPTTDGFRSAEVSADVSIVRDAQGIPHITAQTESDLFFGFGYATAQDRLFQLDYLRRRAVGRLSEILGQEAFELDLLARTVGLHRIAQREWERSPESTRAVVLAYTGGVNAFREECRDRLPIEFDLLDYTPEPWRPQDCLAIEAEFQWYLTGRFPVIVIPELVKRVVGDGDLYRAFLHAEADDECILPGGTRDPHERTGGDASSVGSNNWVIAGRHTVSGKPLVASDPHIAFAAVSCWHEVRLKGAGYNVAGMAYAGMPAVMFGRNEHVAWGCTNNICSLRDLYQEQTDPDHPGCFLYDGRWEPVREREEVIEVRQPAGGLTAVRKTIHSSRNGPIVNQVLPAPARGDRPVSLRWLGMEEGGWLTSLLAMDKARGAGEFREALRPWHVPTFCVVYADTAGKIGYQATGRIPIRTTPERGYRPGWDPAHQWAGLTPFEDMPAVVDPPQGWVITANNRVAFSSKQPLSGTWISGHRGRRIRQMLEARSATRKLTRYDCRDMHQDALSLRAVECLPALVAVLQQENDPRVRLALTYLSTWDGRAEPDRIGCTLFNVFYTQWCKRIAEERFDGDTAALVATAAAPLANALLQNCWIDSAPTWFRSPAHAAVREAFTRALDQLEAQLGPDLHSWTWGRLHRLQQKHVLTARGELGVLLDHPSVPVRGDMTTVCNTGLGPSFDAPTGAGYRLIADLAEPVLHAIDAAGESGVPGSPHYDDQRFDWLTGRYHTLDLRELPHGAKRTLHSKVL